MGKQGQPKEEKKPAEQPAPQAKGAAPHGGSQQHHAPATPKGSVGSKIGCLHLSCKEKDSRMNFCDEHFRQFKFGLITKNGEKVLDYEKKFEHYQNWLRAQKVA